MMSRLLQPAGGESLSERASITESIYSHSEAAVTYIMKPVGTSSLQDRVEIGTDIYSHAEGSYSEDS